MIECEAVYSISATFSDANLVHSSSSRAKRQRCHKFYIRPTRSASVCATSSHPGETGVIFNSRGWINFSLLIRYQKGQGVGQASGWVTRKPAARIVHCLSGQCSIIIVLQTIGNRLDPTSFETFRCSKSCLFLEQRTLKAL